MGGEGRLRFSKLRTPPRSSILALVPLSENKHNVEKSTMGVFGNRTRRVITGLRKQQSRDRRKNE